MRERLFGDLTRGTNVIGLYHLIMFADRSKRLTYHHSCKCQFCTLQIKGEVLFFLKRYFFFLVIFFAGNLLTTVYLDCGDE